MHFDRKYLVCSLAYAAAGMALGVYMGASQNHGQLVAHAHILLVGFVVSFIYAIIHKLWLTRPSPSVANTQFLLHQIAAVAMLASLLLLYGGVMAESVLGPILGISSVGVLLGALLMIYMVLKFSNTATASA